MRGPHCSSLCDMMRRTYCYDSTTQNSIQKMSNFRDVEVLVATNPGASGIIRGTPGYNIPFVGDNRLFPLPSQHPARTDYGSTAARLILFSRIARQRNRPLRYAAAKIDPKAQVAQRSGSVLFRHRIQSHRQ